MAVQLRDAKAAIEYWPLDRLQPYARNARTHSDDQIAKVAASIQRFGFTNPVLITDAGGIIAGHGRVMAAKSLGMAEVPVIVVSGWTDEERRAYVIADNQLALEAGWDRDLLTLELGELRDLGFDLSLTGFDTAALDALLTVEFAGLTDPDEVPVIPAKPVSRQGDLWIMGRHRLICGDCRDREVIDRLCDGRRINLAFTSPPYAEQREYDVASGFVPIHPDLYVAWFEDVAANVAAHLADDGSWFVNIKANAEGLDTSLYVFDLVIAHVRKWGWHFATEFCWERSGVPKGVTQRFKNQFEPIYQFVRNRWKMRPEAVRHESDNVPMAGGPGSGDTSWAKAQGGDMMGTFGAVKKHRNATKGLMSGAQGTNASVNEAHGPGMAFPGNRLSFDAKPTRSNLNSRMDATQGAPEYTERMIGEGLAFPGNRLPTFSKSHTATGHAAAFPVGLPEFFCKAYTDQGDVVFDPFCGSGSTIIAAETTGRDGLGAELSPAYCDVIVERWEKFTGGHAMLDGVPFSVIKDQRSSPDPSQAARIVSTSAALSE